MTLAITVPRIPIFIREEKLIEDALKLIGVLRPKWIEEKNKNGAELKTKMFSEGVTNKLFSIRIATAPLKEMVMVKVYGNKTDLMIDREAEINTFNLLHVKKCGAELNALFENGICYEFIPGENLKMEICRSPQVYELVAKELARIHKSIPLPMTKDQTKSQVKTEIWAKMRSFYNLNVEIFKENAVLREKLQTEFGYNVETVQKDIDELEEILEGLGMPVVFCHNDTSLNNLIYNADEKTVRFIDFEYGFPNYGPFDVANHFMEFTGFKYDSSLYPKREFRSKWISHYLSVYGTEGFSQEQFERWVEMCFPLSDLLWAIWFAVQAHLSTIEFDYVGCVGVRYSNYKKLMQEIRKNVFSPE